MAGVLEKTLSTLTPYDKISRITIHHKEPLEPKNQNSLLAWATKVDITPPPGLPTAGHSLYSTFGVGFRNKLMARVVYIKPKQGRPVALVQCDLISGSRIVHHKVAQLIADKTDVDSSGLAITATHTHSGPGNYAGNNFYNDVVTNRMGFVEKYFIFICHQIASAIIEAYEHRKPARIATGTTSVEGVTKNRSLPAYLMNKNIRDKKIKPNEFEAINPYLHMIRIDCQDDQGNFQPVGAFTNFSNHPNSRPSELDNLYHGDVTAFSERILEQRIKNHYHTPWDTVHAAANHTHGDCNPNHNEDVVETFDDLRGLGESIANQAFDLFLSLDKELKDDVVIRSRSREIDLLKENKIDNIQLAERPAMGMASVAGAHGRGRGSLVYNVPFFAAGYPRKFFTNTEQGHKHIAFGFLQKLRYKKQDYPHKFFAQVIQVDNHILLPLPWEVTLESGKRISEFVKEKAEAAGLKEKHKYIITNVSNGYFGYMTTPEEYSLQFYEGGSNHYGPNTCDFVKLQLGREIKRFVRGDLTEKPPEKYTTKLLSTDFYPKELQPKGNRKIQVPPTYQRQKAREEAYWSATWFDVPPCLIDFHRPLVLVEVSTDNSNWETLEIEGTCTDDSGMDISVRHLNQVDNRNMGLYEVRWHNPKTELGKHYRFKILPRHSQDAFCSPCFISNIETSSAI